MFRAVALDGVNEKKKCLLLSSKGLDVIVFIRFRIIRTADADTK